jgi:23S rRNA-/tRNA-specific pseudouridylate synthase
MKDAGSRLTSVAAGRNFSVPLIAPISRRTEATRPRWSKAGKHEWRGLHRETLPKNQEQQTHNRAFVTIAGRKHQLRIHCSRGLGAPIVGDSKHGMSRSVAQRGLLEHLRLGCRSPPAKHRTGLQLQLQLHCATVAIRKPGSQPLVVKAPLPQHIVALLDVLGIARHERGSGGA